MSAGFVESDRRIRSHLLHRVVHLLRLEPWDRRVVFAMNEQDRRVVFVYVVDRRRSKPMLVVRRTEYTNIASPRRRVLPVDA